MACFYHNYTSDRIPQNINYTVNLIAISIIVYYKYYERGETDGRVKEQDNPVEEKDFQQRVLCRIRSKRRRRAKIRNSRNDEGRTEINKNYLESGLMNSQGITMVLPSSFLEFLILARLLLFDRILHRTLC